MVVITMVCYVKVADGSARGAGSAGNDQGGWGGEGWGSRLCLHDNGIWKRK